MVTTITDPQSWLSALPGPSGPTRGQWTSEGFLAPGDVNENGELVLYDCVTQAAGFRSVEMHQAVEATYYGWQLSGMTVYRGDKVMTQIFRYT